MKQKKVGYTKVCKGSSSEHHPNDKKDGVDLSLIQWMLSFTPTERLQILQQHIRTIMRLRGDKTNT